MPTHDDEIDLLDPSLMTNPPQTVMNASTEDFTGGPATEAVQEGAVIESEQRLDQAGQEYSLVTVLGAAARETPTAHIIQGINKAMSDPEFQDFDPDFDAFGSAKQWLNEYNIPDTEKNLEMLSEAGTAEDQAVLAERLRDADFRQQVLAEHGGWAFATQMLDPTYLVADLATFGATRALRLGRAASAAAGATTFTGVTAGADVAGMETEAFDYILGAALTGGAFSLFGGEAANLTKSGAGNWYGKPTGGREAPPADKLTEWLSETDTLIGRTEKSAPFIRKLVDDPVRRAPYTSNNNAASIRRRFDNELEGYKLDYDRFTEDFLKKNRGQRNVIGRKWDLGGNYSAAKHQFNNEVANELLQRNHEFMAQGVVSAQRNVDDGVRQAADIFEKMMNRSGEILRDSRMPGFEDFTPQPGYFPRVWNGGKITKIGEKNARSIVKAAAVSGIRGITDEDAATIATAVVQRAIAKREGQQLDFFGSLGGADTNALRELMEEGGMEGASLDAAVARLESRLNERSTMKYAKSRIPLDMSARIDLDDGSSLSMLDLIDTDLDRLAANYTGVVSGRSALARAGIGRTDTEINNFKKEYLASVRELPEAQFQRVSEQFDSVLSDFTGNLPPQNRLTPNQQKASALATGVMLTASGMWQAAEYATIGARFGMASTASQFLKQFPGARSIFKEMNGNVDLAEEFTTVLNLDLARDVRFRPWAQQHDAFLDASNTWVDRTLHAGKQAVPFINGMKYIQSHQSKMVTNLATNKLARAMAGDAAAIKMIRQYAPDLDLDDLRSRVQGNISYKGKNAQAMNWDAWADADVDAATNVILRMADDALLFGRTGQGSSFARDRVGQLLGQFRSFVSFAHNKLLRGTLHNGGEAGGRMALAHLLAYQYPATVMMVFANEARLGRLDVEDDQAIQDVMKRAIGYTAGLGFFSDAAGIVGFTGGRGGASVPIMGLADSARYGVSGAGKIYDGEVQQGVGDIAKGAATVLPIVNGLPGTAIAIEAMRSE